MRWARGEETIIENILKIDEVTLHSEWLISWMQKVLFCLIKLILPYLPKVIKHIFAEELSFHREEIIPTNTTWNSPQFPLMTLNARKLRKDGFWLIPVERKHKLVEKQGRPSVDGQYRLGDSTVMIDVDMTHYNQFVVLNCCCLNNRRHFHGEVVWLGWCSTKLQPWGKLHQMTNHILCTSKICS